MCQGSAQDAARRWPGFFRVIIVGLSQGTHDRVAVDAASGASQYDPIDIEPNANSVG
jgi:hypothetical protein